MSEIDTGEPPAPAGGAPEPYRVLARKYRPASFDDLIGQEPMVRTLTNAFETGRIAQAWMLTGVRGVGKTTTARILARALNYETDEIHQPTIHMAGPGIHCPAIMEGRHVDVVEMDAASHTGIDDVREIIAQVRYRPVSARYKVYIIDEVHMLSNQAFNGLLKTLEEPPEHVKFVFATTEIRKVPITVLSRCQRFDLRRVDTATLMAHLAGILQKESVPAEEDGLRLIARAAEGSVRDALSLADQAIAHGAGRVDMEAVRAMLGLADRVRVIDLFEMLMKGEARAAIGEMREQYAAGADPAAIMADLAEFTHLVSTLRYVPESAEDAALAPVEAERGLAFSRDLSIRTLDQVYQLLLKALDEVRTASQPRQAAEMALIRIAHAADMPSPEDLLKLLEAGGAPISPGGPGGADEGLRVRDGVTNGGSNGGGGRATTHASAISGARMDRASGEGGAQLRSAPHREPRPEEAAPQIGSLSELHALALEKRDSLMAVSIRRYVKPVRFETGRIEFELGPGASAKFVGDLTRKLHDWTGRRIVISLAREGGGPTLEEIETNRRDALLEDARADPEVARILSVFPGARVVDVRLKADFQEDAATSGLADDVQGPDESLEQPDEDD